MRLLLAFLIGLFSTSCDPLSFGEDVKLGPDEFGQQTLDQLTQITGVRFPAGSEGQHYAYYGSGIDDSLSAKVALPAGTIDEFKTNAIFEEEPQKGVNFTVGNAEPWWQVDQLTTPVSAQMRTPHGGYLQVFLGKEGDRDIVYIHWFTI